MTCIDLLADGVGFEPTEGFHLRRFSRPVLSTAQSPIRLVRLLCTLACSLWQVISKVFNYAIIVYIFYILYEKVATVFFCCCDVEHIF